MGWPFVYLVSSPTHIQPYLPGNPYGRGAICEKTCFIAPPQQLRDVWSKHKLRQLKRKRRPVSGGGCALPRVAPKIPLTKKEKGNHHKDTLNLLYTLRRNLEDGGL